MRKSKNRERKNKRLLILYQNIELRGVQYGERLGLDRRLDSTMRRKKITGMKTQ
jgi:hypothetical protein